LHLDTSHSPCPFSAHLCTIVAALSCRSASLSGDLPVPAGTVCSGYSGAQSASRSQGAEIPQRSGLPARSRNSGRQWQRRCRVPPCSGRSRDHRGEVSRRDADAQTWAMVDNSLAVARHALRAAYAAENPGACVYRWGIRCRLSAKTWLRDLRSGAGRSRRLYLRANAEAMAELGDAHSGGVQ
jgi:hypothetical protein